MLKERNCLSWRTGSDAALVNTVVELAGPTRFFNFVIGWVMKVGAIIDRYKKKSPQAHIA